MKDRRLRWLCIVSLLGVMGAARGVQGLMAPSYAPGGMAEVAITRTDGGVEAAVRRAVSLTGGLDGVVEPGDVVVVKINMVMDAAADSGMVTDPAVARVVVQMAREAGAGQVIIAEGTAQYREGDPNRDRFCTQAAFQAAGYDVDGDWLDDGTGAPLVDLNDSGGTDVADPAKVTKVVVPQGLIRKEYWLPNTIVDADVLISVPVFKNHYLAGVTLGMKNLIGMLPADLYHGPGNIYGKHSLAHGPIELDQHIVDLSLARRPDFVVVDGQRGMIDGPIGSQVISPAMDLILAGRDVVAVDTVGSLVMGYDPRAIPYLQLAGQNGLGTAATGLIQVEGVPVMEARRDFPAPYADSPAQRADAEPPEVALTTPTADEWQGVVMVGVEATDNDSVARVDLFLDGQRVGQDLEPPYEFELDTGQYAPGLHTAAAVAYDQCLNQQESVREVRFGTALVDTGFRPNADGYAFANDSSAWGSYPESACDLGQGELARMFGQEAVCRMVGGACTTKPIAAWWAEQANQALNGGHSDGMAATSLRFFKELDDPAAFQPGAAGAYDLELASVRGHIASYAARQLTIPLLVFKEQSRQAGPSETLAQLLAALSGPAPDPATLFLREAGQGGHTLSPYAIEDRGAGVYWVRVYDANHPDDAGRYVAIDTGSETWSYDLGWAVWSGDAYSQSVGAVPISQYGLAPACPWGEGAAASQVWSDGVGQLLIANGEGQRLGYAAGQPVSEIPGAYAGTVDGGLGVEVGPVYSLPPSGTYTVTVTGTATTRAGGGSISQFGPGYAVQVDRLVVPASSSERLVLPAAGAGLRYESDAGNEVRLGLALEGVDESYAYRIDGADVGADEAVTLAVDRTEGYLIYDNAEASGGVYRLEMVWLTGEGTRTFVHAGVVISATDTHYADYGSWDGSGAVTLGIDHGSDGEIDETLSLDNQIKRIYLPLVLRDSP